MVSALLGRERVEGGPFQPCFLWLEGKAEEAAKGNQGQPSPKVKCFECQGFGHFAQDCPNRKGKGKSKVLAVKWDDNESDSDDSSTSSSGDEVANYTAFAVTVRDVGEPSTSNREPERSDDEDCYEGERLIRKYSRFLKSERKNKEKTDSQKVLKEGTSQIRTDVDPFRTKCLRLVKKVEELEKELKISKDRETRLEHKVKSLEKDLENC